MMGMIPPVPETDPGGTKSVQIGSVNVFLYCTVYHFPASVGKDRLKKPLAFIVGVPMTSPRSGEVTQPQLAEAVTVRD